MLACDAGAPRVVGSVALDVPRFWPPRFVVCVPPVVGFRALAELVAGRRELAWRDVVSRLESLRVLLAMISSLPVKS